MSRSSNVSLGCLILLALGSAAAGCAPETGAVDDVDSSEEALTQTIEAEGQTWSTSSGAGVDVGSAAVRLKSSAVGNTFSFSRALTAGTYKVTLRIAKRSSYGSYRLDINGASAGTFDAYTSNSSDVWQDVTLGTVTLTSAATKFKFVVTGKNGSASDYDVKVDNIRLVSTSTSSTSSTTSGSGGSSGTTSSTTGSGGGSSGTGGASPTVTIAKGDSAALVNAITNAKANDVIGLTAGTYDMKGKKLVLKASHVTLVGPVGTTILDYGASSSTNSSYGLDIQGSSNLVKGITFTHAPDNGIHITGSDNTVERCVFHDNYDSGLQISGPEAETNPHPANNLILNCDSYDNHDTHTSAGGDADGFAAKINIGPGNKFMGCVAHDNSDDGWDTFPKTASGTNPITIENCVAYHNGYIAGKAAGNGNGFKVGSDQTGGAKHVIKNSVAFNNPAKGFDENHNKGRAVLDHCTGVNNQRNYGFDDSAAPGVGADITSSVANGTWQQSGGVDSGNVKNATMASFTNTNTASISRAADGTLHLNGFMSYKPSAAGAHF
jgi:pectate disaccharide-lyase